jgi:hypothetical protein
VKVFANVEPLELASSDYGDAVDAIERNDFPIINDFAIELRDSEDYGQHVYFVSPSRGELVSFPYWDNVERDMRHFASDDMPLSTMEEPFEEADVDWQIVIFEDGGFAYVLEGSEPHATKFDVWFRVPLDRYVAEWTRVIDEFNPIEPLG